MTLQGKSDIPTIKIKLPTYTAVQEAQHICELIHDCWEDSSGLPFPKMYPHVSKDNYLIVPLIKRVLEEVILRCDDKIDIANDNIGFLNSSFAANNDKAGHQRLINETNEYKEQKKAVQAIKRSVLAHRR
jgi:hypothetical protein